MPGLRDCRIALLAGALCAAALCAALPAHAQTSGSGEIRRAETLRRNGDLLGAIRVLETLAKETPRDTALQTTLERWRLEFDLQLRMQQTYGDHFAVSFEGPAEEALALKAVESLTRALNRICAVLNTYPTATIPVVLY